MAQFLIVQGEIREEVEPVFRSGLQAFEKLARLQPISLETGKTCAAVFPTVKSGSAGIVRGEAEGEWACGAGVWFVAGETGEQGLGSLSRMAKTDCGDSWSKRLDGAFALAVNRRDGRLLLITDPLGTFHVYVAQAGKCVMVSTSSMVLAAVAEPEWDLAGCREFLATGTIFEAKTLFAGVEKLPPATVSEFAAGRQLARRKYWSVADVAYDRAPTRGGVVRLADALRESVAVIARNFPNPLLDLTGGFDSRAVLGAALAGGFRFDTVVSGGENDPDVVVSRQIASRFDLPSHWNAPLRPPFAEWWNWVTTALPLCDGELDVLSYARTAIAHTAASRSFDASINGSNGEVCKGYWWELLFPYTRRRDHFDPRHIARSRFAVEEEPGLLAGSFSESLVDQFAGIIRRANAGMERHPNTAKLDNVYLTLRMQRWQGRIASSTGRIWPCISPFSFRGPMEAALSSPPGARLRNRMSRRLIEHFSPELARLPLADGYPAAPLRLTTAHRFWPLVVENARAAGKLVSRRLGWSPASSSMQSPYPFSLRDLWRQEEIAGLLDPSAMVTRPLYESSRLRDFLAASQQEQAGKARYLGRVLVLEMTASAVRNARVRVRAGQER